MILDLVIAAHRWESPRDIRIVVSAEPLGEEVVVALALRDPNGLVRSLIIGLATSLPAHEVASVLDWAVDDLRSGSLSDNHHSAIDRQIRDAGVVFEQSIAGIAAR